MNSLIKIEYKEGMKAASLDLMGSWKSTKQTPLDECNSLLKNDYSLQLSANISSFQ